MQSALHFPNTCKLQLYFVKILQISSLSYFDKMHWLESIRVDWHFKMLKYRSFFVIRLNKFTLKFIYGRPSVCCFFLQQICWPGTLHITNKQHKNKFVWLYNMHTAILTYNCKNIIPERFNSIDNYIIETQRRRAQRLQLWEAVSNW